MNGEAEVERTQAQQIVSALISVGRGDTLYRDLYLERARALLTPQFPPEEYVRLRRQQQELELLHHQSQGAVERNDWQQARDLTLRIAIGTRESTEREPLRKLAAEVYDAPEVVLDPFTPGLQGFIGNSEKNRAELLERLLQSFALLEQEDERSRQFYAGRRSWFEAQTPTEVTDQPETAAMNPEQLRKEALQAVERGDVGRFDYLMEVLQQLQKKPRPGGNDRELAAESPAASQGGLSEASVAAGRRLGFEPATLPPAPEAANYLHKYAWQPAATPPQFNPDGSIRLPEPLSFSDYSPETAVRLTEILSLFILHPFITSTGFRYLPQCMEEHLLVETFPEGFGSDDAGKMILMLGLPRRWGLSRSTIERALLAKGPEVLRKELGLDPCTYRITCIPADAYCRLGSTMGWGLTHHWTHFDGYQILQNGSFRALVGGDVRYGGTFDMCSISRNDERQSVVTRFDVVSRARLTS